MRIVIVGTGYVGLTTGVCFAHIGHRVTCVEINADKLRVLRAGQVPFFEPGLAELLSGALERGAIDFVEQGGKTYASADAIFLAVQTPQAEDGRADLTYVLQAAEEIGRALATHGATQHPVIVTKSTVPVGTAELIKTRIAGVFSGEFDIASNPEFLREGNAVKDFLEPDRIVMGASNTRGFDVLDEIYAPVSSAAPRIHTNIPSSEMIKYASNAFLATKISFINEIANVCESNGADVTAVARGMGLDHRIGSAFLQAGIGYGGSCFPKDVRALHSIGINNGYDFKLLTAVIEVNNAQRRRFVDKILARFGGSLAGKKIAVLGLAFKRDTDDVRESAAIDIVRALVAAGAQVTVYDPVARDTAQRVLGDVCMYAESALDAVHGVDALVIATEWEEFVSLDWAHVATLLKQPLVFDGKNILSPETLREHGLTLVSIGR